MGNIIGKVYKAVNQVTQEVYIGITNKLIKTRKKDHLQKARKGVGGAFQEAIRTYGEEAFVWEEIDTASCSNELAEKEKKYIIQYSSNLKGYNSDSGGGIKKNIYQYNIETKELIQVHETLDAAAISINGSKQDISRACLSANGSVKGYYWSYKKNVEFIPNGDSRKKKVIQLDLNYNVIDEFISVTEAATKSGLSKTCISRVCRGERDSSGGYIWKYKD
ncbi:NUMOD1 domain-containing DNA-binding protein [Christiangramia echinicola]|uniref:NUMOD1 domain-containing DNA-binding protein n=1 Tax=Christiangramia echinicola TaxID=279359 RepID=UPI0004270DA0|nr:NUMOD1 domain-containing DNA-binding protein [Christiangramia echinicola]